MGFFDIFTNYAETKELHKDGSLRTRYYKTNYRKAKEVVLQYATDKKLEVRNVDDNHGELYLQNSRFHMIVSVIQVTPLETAIDVKVQTYAIAGLGKPKKLCLELYKRCNEHLTYKGVSLHP